MYLGVLRYEIKALLIIIIIIICNLFNYLYDIAVLHDTTEVYNYRHTQTMILIIFDLNYIF